MTIPKRPSQPGCESADECIEICEGASVYVEERGIRATFLNPRHERIRKIAYDGCYCKEEHVKQADFIVGLIDSLDVIVELKGTDANLRGGRGADRQVEYTLHAWQRDSQRAPRIAALIIFGKIEGKRKRPGRRPRANAAKEAVERDFLRRHKILLLVHENGEKQFRFTDFMRGSNAR
jgi:hypothetical protein